MNLARAPSSKAPQMEAANADRASFSYNTVRYAPTYLAALSLID